MFCNPPPIFAVSCLPLAGPVLCAVLPSLALVFFFSCSLWTVLLQKMHVCGARFLSAAINTLPVDSFSPRRNLTVLLGLHLLGRSVPSQISTLPTSTAPSLSQVQTTRNFSLYSYFLAWRHQQSFNTTFFKFESPPFPQMLLFPHSSTCCLSTSLMLCTPSGQTYLMFSKC